MTEQPHEQHATANEDPAAALAAWAGRVAGAAAIEPIAKQALMAAAFQGGSENRELTKAAGRAATEAAVEQLHRLEELVGLGAIPGEAGDSIADAVREMLGPPPFAAEPTSDD